MRTLIVPLLLVGMMVAGGLAEAKSPPPGTGAADVPANILLMVDTSGSMDTILTDEQARYPMDIAFDSQGNIYVAKYYHEVAKYSPDGEFIMEWGQYGDDGDPGTFEHTYSVAIDSQDQVYVSDWFGGRVQVFNTDGVYQRELDLNSSQARGIAIDADDNVYVVDGGGDVQKYTSTGTKLAEWTWTNPNMRQIAIADNGTLYITTWSNDEVHLYNQEGNKLGEFDVPFRPLGIAINSSGNLMVGDYDEHEIYEYTPSGNYIRRFGSYGSDPDEFNRPRGMESHPATGEVYVADFYNHRIMDMNQGELLGQAQTVTRLDALKEVLKTIVSDSDLTSGANFGLMQWNSDPQMEVNVSDTGAQEIYGLIDSLDAGGMTHLQEAMELARNYMLGGSSPINPEAPCQQTILIVLSDGFWQDQPDPVANDLFLNHDIRSFVIGFATTGNENYVSFSQNGGTYPDSPLYANNKQNLLDVLTSYIRQIIATQLTFSTPTIIPGVTNEDFILQSTFQYKPNNQWKGRFEKYPLAEDGNIEAAVWDAGELLNAKPADNRNIWTVNNGVPDGINNFIPSHLDDLRELLELDSGSAFTDNELIDLIQFVRGKDSYNEFPLGVDDDGDALLSGERWKLADIFHSRAVVVGPPKAFSSNAAHPNSEAYYRYLNGYKNFREGGVCGGACKSRKEMVYVGSNGGMLHAFNSATGEEEWAFIPPSVVPSLKDMIALETGKSISIHGVDGSPVVKDIYYNNQWRTVLMSGLRQGGHSYFALDITNPDNPQHLFTFSFNPLKNRVSYWNAEGVRSDYDTTLSVPAAYDYSTLGESWSTPVIFNLPESENGKWVAAIGGGFNNAVNSAYGAQLFVIDLENNGSILSNISIGDTVSANNIQNSVPPRITAITQDSTSLFQHRGALLYVSDLEGKLWKVNMTDQGVLYDKTALFNTEATYENDRMVFHEATAALTEGDQLMLFYGTADMQRIGRVDSAIANRAYGYMDKNFPTYNSVTTHTVSQLMNATSSPGVCPSDLQHGWYLNLGASEKITGRVSIKNNTVFLPRYTPNATALCDAGTAALSEVNFLCGATERTTPLGSGMPTEVIVYKNKVYIGISSDASAENLPEGFVKQGNLIVGDPVNLSPGVLRIEGWREE